MCERIPNFSLPSISSGAIGIQRMTHSNWRLIWFRIQLFQLRHLKLRRVAALLWEVNDLVSPEVIADAIDIFFGLAFGDFGDETVCVCAVGAFAPAAH